MALVEGRTDMEGSTKISLGMPGSVLPFQEGKREALMRVNILPNCVV